MIVVKPYMGSFFFCKYLNKVNRYEKSKYIIVIWCMAMMISHLSYASISAVTARAINGQAPEIPPEAIIKLQDNYFFQVHSNQFQYKPIITNNTLHLSLDTTFKDIRADIDFSSFSNSDIIDSDGDQLATVDGFQLVNLSYDWRDKNNKAISEHSLNNLGGNICNVRSSYMGPYSLTISGDVQVMTQFGLPRQTIKTVQQTFTVHADDGICFLRPANLALNIANGNPPNNPNPTGSNLVNRNPAYNTNVFMKQKGFYSWASEKFPTTAFPRAKFQITPLNGLDAYHMLIQQNPNAALTQSSADTFEFGSTKPGQGVDYVIRLSNISTGVDYYYSFQLKPTRSWFEQTRLYTNSSGWSNAGRAETAYNNALANCQSKGADLPTRSELTNSIYAETYPANNVGDYARNNGFSRNIGGGLAAEWGKLYYYAPKNGDLGIPEGDFVYWFYWTKDRAPDGMRYSVGVVEGNVSTVKGSDYYIMCVQ